LARSARTGTTNSPAVTARSQEPGHHPYPAGKLAERKKIPENRNIGVISSVKK
jgi:hypothetical protein